MAIYLAIDFVNATHLMFALIIVNKNILKKNYFFTIYGKVHL